MFVSVFIRKKVVRTTPIHRRSKSKFACSEDSAHQISTCFNKGGSFVSVFISTYCQKNESITIILFFVTD